LETSAQTLLTIFENRSKTKEEVGVATMRPLQRTPPPRPLITSEQWDPKVPSFRRWRMRA
jgi:hypothetical protein